MSFFKVIARSRKRAKMTVFCPERILAFRGKRVVRPIISLFRLLFQRKKQKWQLSECAGVQSSPQICAIVERNLAFIKISGVGGSPHVSARSQDWVFGYKPTQICLRAFVCGRLRTSADICELQRTWEIALKTPRFPPIKFFFTSVFRLKICRISESGPTEK